MPFVTEALWAALPHRASDPDLLIVARWPARRDAGRDGRATRSASSIDLVTGIRNARASAKLPAADWLETLVVVPRDARRRRSRRSGPAIERLARARPLASRADARGARRGGRPGDLAVIVAGGELEATIRPADHERGDADALERARLERELAEAEGWLAAARERLANEAFVARAPAAVVEGARAREAELADQVERLRERLAR